MKKDFIGAFYKRLYICYCMLGNEMDTDVVIECNKIRVTLLKLYHEGVQYTLYMKKALKSVAGKQLKNDLYMPFVFEG